MKKFIKILIFSIFTVLIIGGFSNSAFAIVRTSNIVFESMPLFGSMETGELNFAPGDSISRWIKITNSTNESHRSIIKALNINDVDNFGDAISLQIKTNSIVIYNGTFSDFFSRSEVVLPQVRAGETIQINLVATFIPESNNDYQNKSMGFSILAGLEDVEEVTDRTTVIGGSGGVLLGQKNLIISNENASFSQEGVGDTVISWNTNRPATSQVIYGLYSEGPYVLDLSAPNFGYPFMTIEKDLGINKTTNHVVNISNLAAGEYVYRVVSRASPATVSYEHKFVVFGNNIVYADNKININNPTTGNTIIETDEIDNNILSQEKETEERGSLLTASVGNIMGIPNNWFWFSFVSLIILILFLIIYRRRKDKEEQDKK